MIVIVTGGRDYRADGRIYEELDRLHAVGPVRLLVHGAYRGADMLAGNWARDREINELRMPARWKQDGIGAGPIRNRRMLAYAQSMRMGAERMLLLAFPGGFGTASCVREAERVGVEIRRVAR